MTLKLACAILAGGATACALLGARQARIQAAHELAASRFRQQLIHEDTGRLRAMIAARVAGAPLGGAGTSWLTGAERVGQPALGEGPESPDSGRTPSQEAPSEIPPEPTGTDAALGGGVAPAAGVGDGQD